MSASEFAFLALGLVLGTAAGAALVVVLRAGPAPTREVRLTVTPDSIPRRRSTTLSAGALANQPAEPARGGPGDRREHDRVDDDHGDGLESARVHATPAPGSTSVSAGSQDDSLVGIAIHREPDPTLAALRRLADSVELVGARVGSPPSVGQATRQARRGAADEPDRAIQDAEGHGDAAAAAAPEGHAAGPNESGETSSATGPEAAATAALDEAGPCADARRLANERCAHAGRAREHADAARDALRAAQRAYDDHLTRADRASADADPRAIRAAKEAAQHAFRAARSAATSREAVEAAARDWLSEINRINVAARDAAIQLERERAGANALVTEIERLTVEADAARIAAEAADEACLAAREAVADCEEAAAEPVRLTPESEDSARRAEPSVTAELAAAVPTGRPEPATDDDGRADDAAALALVTGEAEPVILRLVRGDRSALLRVVAALGGDDDEVRRRWQRGLAELVEAIVGRAIEASSLDFPAEGFWAPFTRAQNRDIAAALSALGFRFDGLGGWLDDRIPSQRDLSLAVGYAGLDPMRIRHWPNEAEMPELFRDVRVAADEYLVSTAPGLTLGELVSALGVRADGLADVWNEWGRLRPVLLQPV